MNTKGKAITIAIIFIFLSFIKFFTAKVGYQGDATVALVMKTKPTIGNTFIANGEEGSADVESYKVEWYTHRDYKVLTADESGFAGEFIYTLLILSWWLLAIGLLTYCVLVASLYIAAGKI